MLADLSRAWVSSWLKITNHGDGSVCHQLTIPKDGDAAGRPDYSDSNIFWYVRQP